MKTRLISAILALLIFVPLCFYGGIFFDVAIYILSLICLKEFIDIKNAKKAIPFFVKLISYIFLTLIILTTTNISSDTILSIDYRIICSLFFLFLMPTVLYHDRTKYSINDAFYLIGGVFFLSIAMSLLITVRHISLLIFIYLFIIQIITDTYAYLIGNLIGKHKLIESISPGKTWEGTIAGSIFGVFIATMFYITLINPDIALYKIISITLFLSIVGQFGDLLFSNIKRYFKIKDFSNIMPGHGGILDRLDSITFILLGFMFFTSIL